MLDFWKEYGVIAVLITVALSGYFLVGDRREELMDYTLEMLGSRLVDLAAGEDDRADVARQFARFQERVERDEVSPEMVEAVAANVLNLRVRGAVITPEEAELMLFSEPDEPLPSPPDPAGQRVYSVKPAKPAADGNMEERLKVMFELADAVQIQGDSASYHFHFSQDEHGIHVVLDPAMAARLESGSAQSLYRNLERREWIKWQDNLARDQARSEERMKAQAARLARIESALSAGADVPGVRAVDRWASAQKLAMLGATVNMDTTLLNREIGTLLKQLTLELDSLQGSSVRVIVQHEAAKSGRSGN